MVNFVVTFLFSPNFSLELSLLVRLIYCLYCFYFMFMAFFYYSTLHRCYEVHVFVHKHLMDFNFAGCINSEFNHKAVHHNMVDGISIKIFG